MPESAWRTPYTGERGLPHKRPAPVNDGDYRTFYRDAYYLLLVEMKDPFFPFFTIAVSELAHRTTALVGIVVVRMRASPVCKDNVTTLL